MMPPSDCSVVVRSCGRGPLLARALASIHAQTLPPAEVIVVAIGDEGAAALNGAGGGAACRVVRAPDGRIRGGALNDGLRVMRGQWCAFLDDDDTWAPTFLQEMRLAARLREGEASLGAIVCRTELVYERLRDGMPVEVGRKPFNPHLSGITALQMADANQFTINAALWHARVFDAVGFFREDMPVLEDWEFNFRAALRFRLELLPRMLARYHQRPPDSLLSNTARKTHDSARRKLQERWRSEGFDIKEPAFSRLREIVWRLGSWVRWKLR